MHESVKLPTPTTIGRPSKTLPHVALIRSMLEANIEVRSVQILKQATEEGNAGSRTAMHQLIPEIRNELIRASRSRRLDWARETAILSGTQEATQWSEFAAG